MYHLSGKIIFLPVLKQILFLHTGGEEVLTLTALVKLLPDIYEEAYALTYVTYGLAVLVLGPVGGNKILLS